jgi:integrase
MTTNVAPTTSPITLSAGFSDLLEQTAQRVRDNVRSAATFEMQEAHAAYWARELGAEMSIAEIDELTLERIAARPRLPPKHAIRIAGPETLRKRLSTLKSMLKLQARRRRLARIPEFPSLLVGRPASPSVLTTYQQAISLFESLPLHRAEWYWLALWTGQRASDVERMTWADVDLANRTMRIRSTKTKRTEGVRVLIPGPLFDALKEMHTRKQPEATDHLVAPWPSRKTTLPLHCKRCGLPRMNATALRHTNLSWIAAKTGITPALCKWAGHSSTRQLERTYAHCLPPQLRELTDALNAMAAANTNAGGEAT